MNMPLPAAATATTLDFTPAVGDMAFTPGRDTFAARAPQWDREASFPFANYDDLRAAGFLKLCVPEAHGGLGADYPTYMMVAAEIGRFCGATALTWNMHICSTMWTGVLADGIAMSDHICSTMWTGVLADGIAMSDEQRAEHAARRELHFGRIVNDGALYAQPFSEGTAAAAGRAPFGTSAKKVDGGWLINGRKIWASLSGAANYYGILCTEDIEGKDPDPKDTLYISVPATSEGLNARHREPQPHLQGRVRK